VNLVPGDVKGEWLDIAAQCQMEGEILQVGSCVKVLVGYNVEEDWS